MLTIETIETQQYSADSLAAIVHELLSAHLFFGVTLQTVIDTDEPLMDAIATLTELEAIALAEQICKLLKQRIELEPDCDRNSMREIREIVAAHKAH